jgi:hypothetical protein
MKLLKKIALLSLTCLPLFSYGQNVIYKCTSPKGEVNYLNITSVVAKSGGCVKTDLASQEKVSSGMGHNDSKKTISMPNGSSPLVVYNEEQKNRDSKRQAILGKELEEEETQLKSVTNMLQNLNSSKTPDSAQLAQLTNLKDTHQKNIVSLRKELGMKDVNNSNLPVSLPSNSGLKIEKASPEVKPLNSSVNK